MKYTVATYSLLLGIAILATAIYENLANGQPIKPSGLVLTLFLAPLFGYLIWLRWDWAMPRGREVRRQRKLAKQREKEEARKADEERMEMPAQKDQLHK